MSQEIEDRLAGEIENPPLRHVTTRDFVRLSPFDRRCTLCPRVISKGTRYLNNTIGTNPRHVSCQARVDKPASWPLEAVQGGPEDRSAWQPIATAPLRKAVLVYIPNKEHYGPGIYRAILVDLATEKRWQTCYHKGSSDLLPDEQQPTLWMHLPPPPKGVESEE